MGCNPKALVVYGIVIAEDHPDYDRVARYIEEGDSPSVQGVEAHYATSYDYPTFIVGIRLARASYDPVALTALTPPPGADEAIRAYCSDAGIDFAPPSTWLASFYG